MLQESKYDGVYYDWNSDCQPCESFMAAIKGGNNVLRTRCRVLFSISDQVSAYEKLGKEVSQRVTEYLAEESTFPFPVVHIHDIGHQVKNSQAALERGTHFDGKTSYGATGLSLIMSTCSNEIAERMNKGFFHGALAQFDKTVMNTPCRKSVDK